MDWITEWAELKADLVNWRITLRKLLLTYCILKQSLFKEKDESVIGYGHERENI